MMTNKTCLSAGAASVTGQSSSVVRIHCGRLSQRQLHDAVVAAQERQLRDGLPQIA